MLRTLLLVGVLAALPQALPAAPPALHADDRAMRSGGTRGDDALRAVRVLPDRGWLIAGNEGCTAEADEDSIDRACRGFVQRHDRFGRRVWRREFDSDGADSVEALGVDDRGRILVAGYTTGRFADWPAGGGRDAFVATLSADGVQEGMVQFGDARDQVPRAVAALADGRIAVAGYDDIAFAGRAVVDLENGFVAVLATDAAPGRPPLARWLRSAAPASDLVLAMVPAPDASGDLLLASTVAAPRAAGGGIQLSRIGADGTRRWARQLSDHGFDAATAMLVLPDGRVALAGVALSALGGVPSGNSDPVVVGFDPVSGDTVWTQRQPLGDGAWVGGMVLLGDRLVLSGIVDVPLGSEDAVEHSFPFALQFDLSGTPQDAWLGPLLPTASLRLDVFALPGDWRGGVRIALSARGVGRHGSRGGFDYYVLPQDAFSAR